MADYKDTGTVPDQIKSDDLDLYRPNHLNKKLFTKLSIFSNNFNSWVFLDPDSIPWEVYDSSTSYFAASSDIGIVRDSQPDASYLADVVKSGEYVAKLLFVDGSTFFKRFKTKKEVFNFAKNDQLDEGI